MASALEIGVRGRLVIAGVRASRTSLGRGPMALVIELTAKKSGVERWDGGRTRCVIAVVRASRTSLGRGAMALVVS